MKKRTKKMVVVMMVFAMVFTIFPVTASAAKAKTKTYEHIAIGVTGRVGGVLDMYGKDIITYKYDGNKVISSSPKQKIKSLSMNICEKGYIVCTKKTKNEHKYKSVWYLNFQCIPDWLSDLLGKQVGKALGKLSNLGRFGTITNEYTVYKNGKVTRRSWNKWYPPTKFKKMSDLARKYLLVL